MRVEVYMKPGCSLCDEAIDLLEQRQATWRYTIVTHNILADEQLYWRYRYDIPVITFDGREVLKLRFEEAALDDALTRFSQRTSDGDQ